MTDEASLGRVLEFTTVTGSLGSDKRERERGRVASAFPHAARPPEGPLRDAVRLEERHSRSGEKTAYRPPAQEGLWTKG
jgi:hypothetical protein